MTAAILAISGISIKQDSHGRFCLNDLHKASGGEARHKPSNWLALQQVQELIEELKNTDAGIPASKENQPLITLKGGVLQGTYGVKELIYAYATWISAKFFLRVIRAYDAIVTQKPYGLQELPPLPLTDSMPSQYSRHYNLGYETLTPQMQWHIQTTINYACMVLKEKHAKFYGFLNNNNRFGCCMSNWRTIPASRYVDVCKWLNVEPKEVTDYSEKIPKMVMISVEELEALKALPKPVATWTEPQHDALKYAYRTLGFIIEKYAA